MPLVEESEVEAVRAFLRQAPKGASRWATAQLLELDSVTAHDAQVDREDPSILDDDDDIVQVNGKRERTKEPVSNANRAVLIFAVVVGIAFGVWFAGRDSGSAEAGDVPSLGAEASEYTTFDRIVELEYELREDPDNVQNHLELGVLLFNRKDVDSAKEHWDVVLELDPSNADAWYNMGFFHLSSTPPDMDQARAAWEKVIALAPESDMAKTAQMHLSGLSTAQSGNSDPPKPGLNETDPSKPGTNSYGRDQLKLSETEQSF